MTDPDAYAYRLEQARRLLEDLGCTANGDGSFSLPKPAPSDETQWRVSPAEAGRRANAEAARQGLLRHLTRDR